MECVGRLQPLTKIDPQQAAVAALNTLQSNFSIVDAIRKSGKGMNKQAIPEMLEWCRKIGYKVCRAEVVHCHANANNT